MIPRIIVLYFDMPGSECVLYRWYDHREPKLLTPMWTGQKHEAYRFTNKITLDVEFSVAKGVFGPPNEVWIEMLDS